MSNPDNSLKTAARALYDHLRAKADASPAFRDWLAEDGGRELMRAIGGALESGERPMTDTADELKTPNGPVSIDRQSGRHIEVVGYFATIGRAESYLATSASIDPDALKAGDYGINAPWGVGADSEALDLARTHFEIFWSMGAAVWAPKGTPISGNVSGKGWHTGFDSLEAAALAALASVDPDDVEPTGWDQH